ncbi:HIRAN domain-containing protein [Lysinibacillus xylanilyticus]|uniref:HIRAN domain-containing protein n=1 Tax=Lysinibacillus xylanilyticus TaxID=582475 RepID=A0ABV3W061_9BACI
MIHIDSSDKKGVIEFSEFMRHAIGDNLKSETSALTSSFFKKTILEKDINIFKKLMKKYDVKCYKVIKDDATDIVTVRYLIQFFRHDVKSEKKFMNLNNEISEIQVGSRTQFDKVSAEDIELYKEHLIEDIKYSYFILDKIYEEDAKNIVKHITGINIEVNYVDVINEKFDINGLIYFKVPSWYIPNINNVYNILCVFLDSKINHCIYSDRDGEIRLDRLDIRTKKSDSRVSKVKFRDDLKQVFDSSWEANTARILKYLGINYEVEKTSFFVEDANFSQYYFPDLFLNDNLIIEIKGFWDNASLKKVSLFKEQYKDYKLLIIDTEMYAVLNSLYKDIIENWEDEKVVIKKEKVFVVGINRPERKVAVSKLKENDEVILVRDAENPYDSNAIAVVNQEGNQIGFIRKDWASIYADKLDMGMKYKARINKIERTVISLELERINKDENIIYDIFKSLN